MPEKEHGLGPEEHGRLVRERYDVIAEDYSKERSKSDNEEEILEFISHVPVGGMVLDIGCGAGMPVLRKLVDNGFRAKGIDFSGRMLKLAKCNVPESDLILGDITKVEFPPESFDGIISTYALIHIHKSQHGQLYNNLHRWLKPGGLMLVSTAKTAWEEVAEYYGVSMASSHPNANASVELITDAGLEIIFKRLVTSGDETHLWVLAKKPFL
jgi:SAM-dependent methyltransferase